MAHLLALAHGNLLTGKSAYISSFDNAKNDPKYANDGFVNKWYSDNSYYNMWHSRCELAWWKVDLTATTTVRTVLIIPSDHCCSSTRNVFKLSIGDSTTPSANPVCVDFNVDSGAYECPNAMAGRYLGIYRTTIDFL